MKKIFLMGQRTSCTPFFYTAYEALLRQHFQLQDSAENADFLIFALTAEVRDAIEQVHDVLSRTPEMQLVVVSEEPLWDSLWNGDFTSKKCTISIGERQYPVTVINHFTTEIFDFAQIPYFLTTSESFSSRYASLFQRNLECSDSELICSWQKAPIRAAFYAEHREEAIHDFHIPEIDVCGLSRYRTCLAQGMDWDGVVRVGNGWGAKVHRHNMPDWHGEKLKELDKRAFIVSGLENTHQWNYVSEKIFDAFAVQGVPLYFASPDHSIMRLVPPGSFINLYGLTVAEAVEKIRTFHPDRAFLEQYREAQARLAELFSNTEHLRRERERVVSELVKEFDQL